MLSKTGRYIGGIDPKTEHTKIMEILENGDCVVRYDLRLKTGKLDFSYDDRKVAFHVSSKVGVDIQRVTRLRRYPSKKLNLNAMTFDLMTGRFEKVTECKGEFDCYYPGFTRDGNLVYLQQAPNYNYEFIFLRHQ